MALPETAAVPWRPRMDAGRLRLIARSWTVSTVVQAVPMLATAVLLLFLDPVTIPVGVILLVHAWAIPELYANRGAKVVKPKPRSGAAAEATALGLLGDLVGHEARELHARTGLVLERGALGVWLVGEAGALLVRGRGRRVHCWCVRAHRSRRCRPRIGSRTCCWRCARTSRASRPSPTTPSRARAGACGGGCPRRVRPALSAAAKLDRVDSRTR